MKRILVADDDRNVLFLISELLARSDYEVSQAINGDQALKMARELLPDLVILDIMMPGKDGLEVCRTLKGDPATSSIKVIMVTAKAQGRDREAGLEAGADEYITKPFRLNELLDKIKEAI
jgi:DNA-binding response OmpR family regulator